MASPKRTLHVQPLVLLRVFAILAFAIIVASIVWVGTVYNASQVNAENLFILRRQVDNMTNLAKDFLLTDNVASIMTRWQSTRVEYDRARQLVVASSSIQQALRDERGAREYTWALDLLEQTTPRLNRIEQQVSAIMAATTPPLPGLYDARELYPDVPMAGAINELTTYSLYVSQQITHQVDILYERVRAAGNRSVLIGLGLVFGLSVLAFTFIFLIAGTLGKAQRTLDMANVYLQGLISAVFDLSGQGFLVFDQSLRCDRELSKQATRILGFDPSGMFVMDVLPFDQGARRDFPEAIDIVFTKDLDPGVVFGLFDKDYSIGERVIRLTWRLLPGKLILVVLTDITREHHVRELMAREEAQKSLILKTVAHRRFFADFFHGAKQLFTMVSQGQLLEDIQQRGKEALADLVRHIHTFKGNAMFFGFASSARLAQELEHRIGDAMVLGQELAWNREVATLRDEFAEELAVIQDFMGKEWIDSLDSIAVPRNEYEILERYVKKSHPNDKALYKALLKHRSLPLRALFARFVVMTADLAERLGKLVYPVSIRGGDFMVVPDPLEGLIGSLVHIIRNMLDHGIEIPRLRQEAGKPELGTISIALDHNATQILMDISDDGAGMDTQKILSLARARGLAPQQGEGPSGSDLAMAMQVLFAGGVSTAENHGSVSGLGVGLSAVYAEVRALGGTMSVSTKPGQGTNFAIRIPKQRGTT